MRKILRFSSAVLASVVFLLLALLLSSLNLAQNACAASFISTGDGGWESVMPKPSARQWSAVQFIDDKTGWIIGNHCVIMKTTDGGKNWAPQGPRLPDKFMYDMDFTDKDHGWAVGAGMSSLGDETGIILKTSDSGATWKTVLDRRTDGLRSVCFVNNNIGWAVGGMPGKAGLILKTTDGGETWYRQDCGVSLTDKQMRIFEGVWFVDESTGYVVGTTGGDLDIYKTADGGKTWSHTAMQNKGHAAGVQFMDANTGWVLTNWLILKTTDGGKTWADSSLGKAKYIYSFHFSDAQNGIAITADDGVLRTTDGGKTWTSTRAPGFGGIRPRVHMVDARTGWAVGDYSILKTSDGGVT